MRSLITLCSMLVLAWGSGCTRTETAPPLKKGEPLFAFSPAEVAELEWVTPQFSAQLKRRGFRAWDLVSLAGEGLPAQIEDRRADGRMIEHLLDTLQTLSVEEALGNARRDTLGLDPPLHLLRWKVGDRTLEVRIGATVGDNGHAICLPPSCAPYLSRGATLQMTERVKTAHDLRDATWLTWSADDIDEIQITGEFHGHFEREGTDWLILPSRKRAPSDFNDRWIHLTHQRVQKFDLGRVGASEPQIIVRLVGRATTDELHILHSGGGVQARSTARPSWVALYPEFLEDLKALTQASSTPKKSGKH